MNWTDEGYILNINLYGENSSIVSILSKDHGHHKGVVYGATSSKIKKLLHIGNKIKVQWKSKSENAVGYYNFELLEAITPKYFDDIKRLHAILSATNICLKTLPERNKYLLIYENFENLLNQLSNNFFFKEYVLFEKILLSELGYNLDINDETKNDFIKIFNKTLTYPQFIIDKTLSFNNKDIYNGLLINKFQFLNYIFEPNKIKFPNCRIKLENFFNE